MPNPLQYVAADFTTSAGVVDPEQLRQEFDAASFPSTPVTFSHIDQVGSAGTLLVSVWFSGVPDATDEASADAIVAAHDATGPTDPNPGTEPDSEPHAETHVPGASDALAVAVPVSVTKAANAEGAAASFSRSDHKHDVDTAAPPAASLGATPAEGSAATVARSDHVHQANTAPANVTKAAAAIGTSTEPARADHKHDISTAAPAQGVGGGNTEGSATSLARSDHDHTIRETGGPTNLTVGVIADGQKVVRSGTTLRGAPRAYAESLAEQSTTSSTSPGTQALTVTKTAGMPAGRYRLEWSFTFRRDSTASNFIGIIWDGSSEHWRVEQELADSGTDQRISASGQLEVVLGAGATTYEIRFFGSSGITAYIFNCRMMIEYVGPS